MKKLVLPLCVLILLSVFGCGLHSKKIKISSVDPKVSTELYQNITIKLNQDVCSQELINKRDTIGFLIFDPPVMGRSTWTESDEITFSPAIGFSPATQYSIKLNPIAFQTIAEKKPVSTDGISFSTAALDIQKVHCYWNINNEQRCIQFDAEFNYDIELAELNKFLSVVINKKQFTVNIENERYNDNSASFFVFYPEEDNPTDATIGIEKGMSCIGGGNTTIEKIVAEISIPSIDVFAVTSYDTNSGSTGNTLTLFTSQPVEEKNIKNFISISPTVKNVDILVNKGSIYVKGDFEQTHNYTVTVSKNLKSKFGTLLKEDYTVYISFDEPKPYLSFEDETAYYLSLKGERNLAINAANIQTIDLSIFKIYENNLMHYLWSGNEWDWHYDDEDDDWHEYQYWPQSSRYGDYIFSKKIDMQTIRSKSGQYILKLAPKEMRLDDRYKGMYIIKIQDQKHEWLQSTLMLSMSDIGLMARKGTNNFMVCAVSLQEGKPLSGVKITLVSSNNQEILTETTGADGVVMIKNTTERFNGFFPAMITARKGDDFNFLNMRTTGVNTSQYDLSGKWTNETDFDIFVYGDRELYRPGDSVHINALVRTWNFETIKDVPLFFRIQNPLGETVERYRKIVQENGYADISFALPTYAPTGTWNVTVENGAGVVQKNYLIHVEEFMPDRIKVTTSTDKPQYLYKETIILNAEALNLYGPPAVGRKYEATFSIDRKFFNPKAFSEYNFTVSKNENRWIQSEERTGVTGNDGRFKETFKPDLPSLSGGYQGTIYTTVFDENGRPVHRINQFDIFTQPIFLGIRQHDYWFGTAAPIHFNIIAVNTEGALAKAELVRAVIERSYYENVQVRAENSSRFEYRSQRKTEIMYDDIFTINGKETDIAFTPKISGTYTLKLYLKGSEYFVSSSFYAYGMATTSSNSFAVDKEGNIKIKPDKDEYAPGEKAKLLFTSPFSGTLLVTIESNDIKEYQWLTMKDKSASMELTVKENMMPNCYITATAFRNLSETNTVPLTIARGFANIMVQQTSNHVTPSIDAVAKSRSKTTQKIKIKANPNSNITVAVVDEGILQITNYQTPEPYNYFYAKRAMETQPYDLYPWLFREVSFGNSSSGGDAAFDMSSMVNPLTNRRVNLVAFWSGVLKTNSSGIAETTISIPQFSGNLRIMATEWKNSRFGSASKNIIVSDPIVISSGIPRFLSPGDRPKIPVVIRNTTDKDAQVRVSVNVTPLLKIEGESVRNLKIKAGGEEICYYDLVAANDIGESSIEVNVQALSETFTEKTDITVRPPTGFTSNYQGGTIKSGSSAEFNLEDNFVASTVSSNVMLSNNLATQYTGALCDVVYYPYGCLEQTTSRAFPLLYLDDLSMAVEKAQASGQTTRYVINESIKRIMSMRKSNGSLAYWPGGNDVNMWAECYATHFLTEASKAGYAVDADMMRRLLLHITAHAKSHATDDYQYWDATSQSYKVRHQTAKSVIYALYVLALNGKQEISQMNYYKSMMSELAPDMRCMLASAFAGIGNMSGCNELLQFAEEPGKILPQSGGDFSSYIRNNALMLSFLLDAAPNDPRIPALAQQLNKITKETWYLSTQEKAFTLLAFGKMARKAAKNNVTADITLNQKNIGTFNDKNFFWKSKKGEVGTLNISTKGSGELYYFIETSGIPKTPVKEIDNQLKIRKRYLNKNGFPANLESVQQGDLIYVEITVQTTNTLSVDNVAIQDVLPACFEIENSRLIQNDQQMSFMNNAKLNYDYIDMRDDRITVFGRITPSIVYFYYSVRAVSTGTYIAGAANATAMYDGNYYSIYGYSKVSVK